MRLLIAIPLLAAAAACSVERDPANDQTTIRYDTQPVENVVSDLGNAAEQSISDVDNAAQRAERTLDTLDNINVDVDVNRDRNPPGNSN